MGTLPDGGHICCVANLRDNGGMTHGPASKEAPPSRVAVGAQVVAIVLTGAAVIWGFCMVHVALHPGASGEFGGLSVLFAAAIDIPMGLVSLLVGVGIKNGRPMLRSASIVLSVVALALPFLTKAAWQSQFISIK